jgi:hypothetical protein
MQDSNKAKSTANAKSKPPQPLTRRQRAGASLARRLQAAGLDGDPPKDIDAFRNAMARRISMAINTWQGCPQRLCRRLRGCMAPDVTCSNAEPLPPMSPEEETRRLAEVMRAFKQAAEQYEREQG